MKRHLIIIFATIISITGCNRSKDNSITSTQLAGRGKINCPFLTTNHHNVPVLTFTQSISDSITHAGFSIFDTVEMKFSELVEIPVSKGTSFHEESMNKIAFKPDGTIIAVWEIKHPTSENKYAGSILYSQSRDGGKNWSNPRYVHTDTTHHGSRSFFDVSTLPDGEVGIVWLDGRHLLGKNGSSLYFSKTKDTLGFQTDYQIAESVCQCCRTELYVDHNDIVHITFRDINNTLQGQIRDIAHISSTDNGASFSKAKFLSTDNWIIDGCPHTGASLCHNKKDLIGTWFTAGGLPGTYCVSSQDGGKTFSKRILLSESARHPQISSTDKYTYVVWDDMSAAPGHHNHDGNHLPNEGGITLGILNSDYEQTSRKIADSGSFPVIWSNSKYAIVAHNMEDQIAVHVIR